ncbi:MAG: methyltransferase [Dehalococcoidia bacterium]|nr:methyltransferase [Dehalococcoidia bacterium]
MDVAKRSLPVRLRTKVKRSLWRRLFWWRFRLFQRYRYGNLILEEVAGRPILVLPEVFNPKLLRTGEFMGQTINADLIPAGARVLDMGTGSGIVAILAATWADRVLAVDISPEAVRCARINVLLNEVEDRVEVFEGDLFLPVQDQRFDVVLFNPPYFRGTPHSDLDRAWRSIDVVERFAAGLPDHLKPDGCALVVLSTDGDTISFLRAFEANRLTIGVVAQRDLGNEVLAVYRLTSTKE